MTVTTADGTVARTCEGASGKPRELLHQERSEDSIVSLLGDGVTDEENHQLQHGPGLQASRTKEEHGG